MRMARKTSIRILFVLGLMLLSAGIVSAQQSFTTTIIFDYTNNLSNNGPVTSAPKNSFFPFRRAYFTYENKINDNLKFRFRYDADNTANLTSVDVMTGSTKKDDKLRPFIKHLYLQYDNLIPNASLTS